MASVRSALLVMGLIGYVPCVAASPTGYDLVALGTLHGDRDHLVARAINDGGGVAGDAVTGRGHFAFVFHHEGGMHEIVGADGEHPHASAAALDEEYGVVGASGFGLANAPAHAFLWRPDQGMLRLDESIADTFDASRATGVNGDGTVVGVFSGRGGDRAFVWRADAGMRLIHAERESRAQAVNDAGVIVGTARRHGVATAFRGHDDGNDWEWLPDRADGKRMTSRAAAVSAAGDVVGRLDDTGTRATAFLWTASGSVNGLGHLDPDLGFSEALDVAGGTVVGRSLTREGMRAFVWQREHGMRRLDDLVRIADGTAPVLLGAVATNAAGQIVAIGRLEGNDRVRSFRLDPR